MAAAAEYASEWRQDSTSTYCSCQQLFHNFQDKREDEKLARRNPMKKWSLMSFVKAFSDSLTFPPEAEKFRCSMWIKNVIIRNFSAENFPLWRSFFISAAYDRLWVRRSGKSFKILWFVSYTNSECVFLSFSAVVWHVCGVNGGKEEATSWICWKFSTRDIFSFSPTSCFKLDFLFFSLSSILLLLAVKWKIVRDIWSFSFPPVFVFRMK